MNTKNADLGIQFLLDNYDNYRLRVDYDFDGETIDIEVLNLETNQSTVFDGSDIFRQVHEFFNRPEKRYSISLANGKNFSGSPEDVARWYCIQEHIKLFIEPEGSQPVLMAQFDNKDTCTHIAYLENGQYDIESAYRFFFFEYLLEVNNPDYSIAEIQ